MPFSGLPEGPNQRPTHLSRPKIRPRPCPPGDPSPQPIGASVCRLRQANDPDIDRADGGSTHSGLAPGGASTRPSWCGTSEGFRDISGEATRRRLAPEADRRRLLPTAISWAAITSLPCPQVASRARLRSLALTRESVPTRPREPPRMAVAEGGELTEVVGPSGPLRDGRGPPNGVTQAVSLGGATHPG